MHQRQRAEDMDRSKQAHIPDIISLDSKNDLPLQGVAILDNESDSGDFLPEPDAESEGYYSITIVNDANTLMSPAKIVPSEVSRHGSDPA